MGIPAFSVSSPRQIVLRITTSHGQTLMNTRTNLDEHTHNSPIPPIRVFADFASKTIFCVPDIRVLTG